MGGGNDSISGANGWVKVGMENPQWTRASVAECTCTAFAAQFLKYPCFQGIVCTQTNSRAWHLLAGKKQTPGSQLDCALPCQGLSYSWGAPLNGDKSDSTLVNSFAVIPCQAAAIRRCPVRIENGPGCMDPKDRTCRRRTHRIVHRIDNAFHANVLIELKPTYSSGGMVLWSQILCIC